MKIILFLTRLTVGFIGITNLFLGCCLLIYIVWSLNSITNIATGESLITTSQLVFGSLLSIKGLIGIYGSWKKHTFLLKLFLFLILLTISLEIGLFTSLKVANTKISNFVEQGWKEINDHSRNYIQKELKCCGLTGLSEFANKLDSIDDSCYHYVTSGIELDSTKEPYRVGCKWKLIDWMQEQTKTFLIAICSLLSSQIFSVILVLILLKLLLTVENKDDEEDERSDECRSDVFKGILLEDVQQQRPQLH